MTIQVDRLNATLDILYNRIKLINENIEDSQHKDEWRNLRNEYVNQILVIKRQRFRLLGVIKE